MTVENRDTSTTALDAPRAGKRYFSIDDANASLVYVRRIVDDICTCYDDVNNIRDRVERPSPDDDVDALRTDYDLTMDRLNDLLDELHQVGVEIKDFEQGLIDFPALHQGREVLLCWHLGEDAIGHWHEIDAGFASRQDVALLRKAQKR